jgi:hypothetical protein
MLGSIRTYFFEKEKMKRAGESTRKPAPFRLDRHNHFGLLLDAGSPEDRNEVLAFADYLRKKGNQVKILGFMEGKPVVTNIPFDVITSADLNKLSHTPKSPLVDSFIEHPYEVLINMSIRQNHKALDYISTLSRASFRIGPWYPSQPHNPFDLCIDAGSAATLKEWISELMFTLEKIY